MSTHYNNVANAVSGTPGTGTITLGAAVTGAQSLATAAGGNATVDVFITDGNAWEVARNCNYTHSGTTLTRGTLEASSTGAVLSLTSAAVVRVSMPASTGNLLELQLDRGLSFARSPSTGTQTLTNAAFTKITIHNDEVSDPNGWWDNTNQRFQPTRAGAFLLLVGCQINTAGSSTTAQGGIYFNGALLTPGGVNTQSSSILSVVTDIVNFNGSSDFAEQYVYCEPSRATLAGTGRQFFKAIYLGS